MMNSSAPASLDGGPQREKVPAPWQIGDSVAGGGSCGWQVWFDLNSLVLL
jgi:hypothetical protein